MHTVRRNVRLFRVAINGLPEGIEWIEELVGYFKRKPTQKPISYVTKNHLLYGAKKNKDRLELIFASFALGDRPDVINTQNLEIQPSPLDETQANVSYTHALSWKGKEDYLLLLELVNTGIGQGALSVCLGSVLTDTLKNKKQISTETNLSAGDQAKDQNGAEPSRIRVFLSPISSEEDFFARVGKSDRLSSFAIEFKRHPNPGFSRAINRSAEKADESEANSVQLITKAARNKGLKTDEGVVPWGKELIEEKEADQLWATGEWEGTRETLNSKRMEERYAIDVPVGTSGRPDSSDVFAKVARLVEEIVF